MIFKCKFYYLYRIDYYEKTLLATATLSLLLTSGVALAQNTSSGSINFTGSVTNAACTVDGQGPNGAINIALGQYGQKELSESGKFTGWSEERLSFSNCILKLDEETALTGIDLEITGSGKATTANSQLFSNEATGGAGNVGVEIRVDDVLVDPINGLTAKAPLVKSGSDENAVGSVSFKVAGRIVATDKATPGAVAASVKFNAIYR